MWFLVYIALAFIVISLLLLLSGAILKYTASDGLQGKIGVGLMGAGLVMLPFIPP